MTPGTAHMPDLRWCAKTTFSFERLIRLERKHAPSYLACIQHESSEKVDFLPQDLGLPTSQSYN